MRTLSRHRRARRRPPRVHQRAARSARPRWLISVRRAIIFALENGQSFPPRFWAGNLARFSGKISRPESRQEISPRFWAGNLVRFRRYICIHIHRRNQDAISRPESRQEISPRFWAGNLARFSDKNSRPESRQEILPGIQRAFIDLAV